MIKKQRNLLTILLFTLLALVTGACSAQNETAKAVEYINKGALLVDVRTNQEFNSGHIEGALHIPHDQTAARVAEYGSDKGAPIVVYCRSGNRSGKAKAKLEQLGYTNVVNGGGYSSLSSALK